MTTSPTGILANAEELLRTTLAACSEFQTWTGSLNETEAKNHIYLAGLPVPASGADKYDQAEIEGLRPFAVIYTANAGLVIRRDSATDANAVSGTLLVKLEENVDSATGRNFEETERTFLNTIGGILRSGNVSSPGLEELLNTAGYLHWNSITMDGIWRGIDEENNTMGDYQSAVLRIGWGVT